MLEDKIYRMMKKFAVETGEEIIMKYRGKVRNKGKKSDVKSAAGMAKTVIDEIIQELFLAELYKIAPCVRINVEEKTPLRYLFRSNSGITVHLDPLDGTLSYVEGSDRFSIGCAISDDKNNFTHTVAYFPALRTLVYAAPNEAGSIRYYCNDEDVTLRWSDSPSAVVYENRVFSETGKKALLDAGFEVRETHCSHLCIAEVALKTVGAYIYRKSNPHDSMIPYAFAKSYGAKVVDETGNPITGINMDVSNHGGFCKFERLPFVFYYSRSFGRTDEISDILSRPENKL